MAKSLKARLQQQSLIRLAAFLRSFPFFRDNVKESKPWSKMEMLVGLMEFASYEPGQPILRLVVSPALLSDLHF